MPDDSVSVLLLVIFMHTVNVHRMKIPLLQMITMYFWMMLIVTVVTAVVLYWLLHQACKYIRIMYHIQPFLMKSLLKVVM